MAQRYGVPALLSLFVPGLGQLVKGQWERTVLIYAAMLVPWLILGIHALASRPEVFGFRSALYFFAFDQPALIATMVQSGFLPLVAFLGAIPWLWSVVDAYRYPEGPH